MDKATLKECLKILNTIEESELDDKLRGLKSTGKNNSNEWQDIQSWDFKLEPKVFTSYLQNLNKQGIIKIVSGSKMPETSKYTKGEIFDETGNGVETDDIIISYTKVNVKKLNENKELLKSVLGAKEANDLFYESGIDLSSHETSFYKRLGALELFTDDTIRINGDIIVLPLRLKKLCKVFIELGYETIGEEEIVETLGIQSRQTEKTIRQYISDLNKILKKQLGVQRVFIRESDEVSGSSSWRFVAR